MAVVERGHHPPHRGQERHLVDVRGRGGEVPPELARPVRLDDVEIGVEVLEDVPRQDHVGQPCGPVVAGGEGILRLGGGRRRGNIGNMRERPLAVLIERQGNQRRDAAPEIGYQRLTRLGRGRRIGLLPGEQEAAPAALRALR